MTRPSGPSTIAVMHEELAIRLAAEHNGAVSVDQLRREGVDSDSLRRLRVSRQWTAPHLGVLVRRGSVDTIDRRLTVAVFSAGPGAALSHEPACHAWGQTACRAEPVDVVRLSRSGPRPTGVVVHPVRALPDEWVTELRGIPIVRPELCAMQLFATCRYERAERLVERFWSMRLLSGPSLARFVGRMGARGRNGITGLRRYLDDRGDSYVPSATNLETRVMQILRDVGIQVRRQVDAGSAEVWTGRVDFVVKGLPVVVEVQSSEHHDALTDRVADAQRRQDLEDAGWIWVEVWSREVWSNPAAVVTAVRAGMARARS